jgi:hypothetical protein
LTQAAVAIEAEHASNQAGLVIVVDMRSGLPTTDRAHSLLGSDHCLHLRRADTVSPHQMVVTISAVQSLLRFFASSVMARLAVSVMAVFDVLVAREIFE